MTEHRPKLIEVALPLAAINAEATRDKGIRNHPQSLHRWWARLPLAAVRAVIWASLVDDPSGNESLSPKAQEAKRGQLFAILERLIRWENSNNPDVLAEARTEINRCFPDGGPPPILDPFAGGGAIPLEAQRLGLTALAGDLNPIAVLINKAMTEIAPRFAGLPPVHPGIDKRTTWQRAQGLAADVEIQGQWMREQARLRIGHLYPDATGPHGEKLTPIAWIWARTVQSPDPSWSGQVPLVASWTLSKKPGKPKVWIEPVIDRHSQTISYEVREGGEPTYKRTVKGGDARCIATGSAIAGDYIKSESRAGRMGQQLMAVVVEGQEGRAYVSPVVEDEAATDCVEPAWKPEGRNPEKLTGGTVYVYGLDEWWKLYTTRQLVALTTFSDLLGEVAGNVVADARAAGMPDDGVRLREGGDGAQAYSDAVITYLAFVISKTLDFNCTLSSWDSTNAKIRNVFARQAVPMTWDFAECNVLGRRVGSFWSQLRSLTAALNALPASGSAEVSQQDARLRVTQADYAFVSTDPPYYDNISYADLSDFFYVWLRKNLSDVWPDECATLLTPKAQELIANRYRAGSRRKAEAHFESGMVDFLSLVAQRQLVDIPTTIFYAYKATEKREQGIRSTGWDTFLQAVIDAGLEVRATWPLRTEKPGRSVSIGTNALASSIVLVCRPRPPAAVPATRGEFIAALRQELPEAVRVLQSGNIRPVDMAQSTIGPGIRVFSRYEQVVEADGSSMPVSAALAIINDVLGEVLDGAEADLDADTRFALTWFAEHGYDPGPSGDADSVARAKNTSLAGIEASGVGEARAGKFRLFERSELDPDWSPAEDSRLTVWEATQYLAAALERSESEAAALLHALGGDGDRSRQLAYLLYQRASGQGWASEAGAYNDLIAAWSGLRAGATAVADSAAAEGTGTVQQALL